MDIITLTNRYIIFLFVFLLAFRFFFEKLPQADFHIFLCLPVSKNDLILAYIIRLMGKKLNLLPLFVTIPFWLKNILSIHDFAASIYWLIGFITISFAFALLGLLLKFIFFEMKWGVIILTCILALIIALDSGSAAELLEQGSSFIFDSLLQRDISMLISCVLLPVPFIILTYKALQKTFYLDYN